MMRTWRLSSRDRSAVGVGALALVVLAGLGRGVPAYREWQQEVEAAALNVVREAERARASLATFGATLDSLESRRDRLAASPPALVPGETFSAATAAVAARMSGIAATAQVRLGAVQVSADTASVGAFARVSVRVDATGYLDGIARVLADLETGYPLLAVQEWSISRTGSLGIPDQPEVLRLEFAARGLMRRPEPAGAP